MISLIWFCLISYGLTQILVYGKILDKIRPKQGFFGDLLSCAMCTGFWAGAFLWCVSGHTKLFNFDDSYVTGLLLGFAASAAAYVGNMVFGDDGIRTENLIQTKESENGNNIQHN